MWSWDFGGNQSSRVLLLSHELSPSTRLAHSVTRFPKFDPPESNLRKERDSVLNITYPLDLDLPTMLRATLYPGATDILKKNVERFVCSILRTIPLYLTLFNRIKNLRFRFLYHCSEHIFMFFLLPSIIMTWQKKFLSTFLCFLDFSSKN